MENEQTLTFPALTLHRMIVIANEHRDTSLYAKLVEILALGDPYKQNRWMGYYQRVGEEKGYWSLDDVISWVRDEKQKKLFKHEIAFIPFTCKCGVFDTLPHPKTLTCGG